jgi:hypothetical protein
MSSKLLPFDDHSAASIQFLGNIEPPASFSYLPKFSPEIQHAILS